MVGKDLGKKYPHSGHRSRLRDKFLRAGLDGFNDYEIVELLLTLGTPRKDCKQSAKLAIRKFGGLRQVLDAPVEDLQAINGIGPLNGFGLKLFQAVAERYAREKIPPKINLHSPQAVAEYLQKSIGGKDKEYFVGLYLNARNQLTHRETISIGTLENSLVHPREVFEPALKHLASGVIVAHNHPSGDTQPSEEDLAITKRLVKAGEIIGIELVDHIIITDKGFVSLKEKGVVE